MQLLERKFLSIYLLAFQVAAGLAMPTSAITPAIIPPQWPGVLETARFFVSIWLNETTAIIAAGAIIGLAAASFAVSGFDWRDYDQGPSDRLITKEDPGFKVSAKHADV